MKTRRKKITTTDRHLCSAMHAGGGLFRRTGARSAPWFFLLACVAFSLQASAADFRTLDFGQSCAHVTTLEQKLGSVSQPSNDATKSVIAFKGKVFGRNASIRYFCPGGVLFTGNYVFDSKNLDSAVKTYRDIYQRLNTMYGTPVSDSTPWHKGAAPNKAEKDPRKYLVDWRQGRSNITLSIYPTDQANEPWEIFMVVGRNRS